MNNNAKTNILIALKNLLDRDSCILTPIFRSNGKANAAGDSLEFFIKDIFCTGASQYQYVEEKMNKYTEFLSWSGNSSNFPDFIIRGGPGVEPKKIEGEQVSNLALNSSYPKDYIYPDSQNLPKVIDESNWSKKDVIYATGNLNKQNNKLYSLWMVYGNTMIADRSVYLALIDEIRNAIKKTNASLKNSKELARAKGIDPLKISNLRVRGMYELEHPQKYFSEYKNLVNPPKDSTSINIVILKENLEEIINKPNLEKYIDEGKLKFTDIKIPNPNNTMLELEAVLIETWTK